MEDISLVAFVAYVVIGGAVGAAVASSKRASIRQGFCWGFVLGPLGWLIAALVLQPLDAESAMPKSASDHAEKIARARALAAKLEAIRAKEER